MVYVINGNGTPLMPTNWYRCKRLLNSNKAKVYRREPFTIKLNYITTEYTQELTCGIDTGSSYIGNAVVNNSTNEVLYMSETKIRNNITSKMDNRRIFRRSRRNRKTRYRKYRFLNRASSRRDNRLPPTLVSKINSHKRELTYIKKILPINKVILETANFDIHAMKDPSVRQYKWKYQKGIQYGYANTRAYILHRDKYKCHICNSGNTKLEVHHILFRSEGGSNDVDNLITLCDKCHDKIHNNGFILNIKGKRKNSVHTTQMNIIRSRLLKDIECEETFGYITKEHRLLLKLDKSHYNDAITIASLYNIESMKDRINYSTNGVLYKRHVSCSDKQRNKRYKGKSRKIPTGKLYGFRKFDKVMCNGKLYFISSKRTAGYFTLMDIHGTITYSSKSYKKLKRINARKSTLIYMCKK